MEKIGKVTLFEAIHWQFTPHSTCRVEAVLAISTCGTPISFIIVVMKKLSCDLSSALLTIHNLLFITLCFTWAFYFNYPVLLDDSTLIQTALFELFYLVT